VSIATRKDVISVFPDLQDHAVVEILDMKASVEDLEAALGVLMSDDKDLIEVRQREGGQIHRLLNILNQAGVQEALDRDR
jgi:hypothetical protein